MLSGVELSDGYARGHYLHRKPRLGMCQNLGRLVLVIVDTPPGLEQRLLISKLIRRADFVLVPTSQSTADLASAEEFMGAATAFGNNAAFLLSRTNQRWGSYRVAKKLLNSVGD